MDIPPRGQFFVSGMLCRESALGQRANNAAHSFGQKNHPPAVE
jgi:hypothetical protein